MTAATGETHVHHETRPPALSGARQRPRWLVPVLGGAATLAVLLVVFGVLSASALVYLAVIAGCGLMHVFGHGGHGGHGGGNPPAER